MFIREKKGQSILEYAILLAVVIAALLIMQAFVKRGVSGGLKESADKMGEQFSAGGTTIHSKRTMATDQTIKEEVATDETIGDFLPSGKTATGTLDKGAHSFSSRTGGQITSLQETKTESAAKEKVRFDEYQKEEVENYNLTQ